MKNYLKVSVVMLTLVNVAHAADNGTILQYFDFTTTNAGTHWNTVKNDAATWVNRGITAFWLPPAYKGNGGSNDAGYGVYDVYDMGEFNAKGSVRTKYGTRTQYEQAITAIHAANAQVYADIVVNHKMGAEATENVNAVRVRSYNRNEEYGGDVSIQAWTKFDFPGRQQADGTLKYNNFRWRWYHFDGVDWAQNLSENAIFKFRGNGKAWDDYVALENGNYDYLMGADLDFQHSDVISHLKDWGVWYTNTFKLDGFRLDATKHIRAPFFNEWLYHVRNATGKSNAIAISEYWEPSYSAMNWYLQFSNSNANDKMHAFDVPLHYKLKAAADGNGFFDMSTILNDTLMKNWAHRAITFVDNHDTLSGRSLASQVADWFKPSAYALILLHKNGYPTVFVADWAGAGGVANHSWLLERLMKARKHHAYGVQNDYFDHGDVVGFTREGDASHWYGMAVLISDNRSSDGSKWMFMGNAHKNKCFSDATEHFSNQICTNSSGWGNFTVRAGKTSVWVQAGKFGLRN